MLDHIEPKAFNKDFRPGLGECVSEEYGEYCERYPNATQEERKQKHLELTFLYTPFYPTVEELEEEENETSS